MPARTAAPPRRSVDVVAALTVYLVLLFGIPPNLVVGPLGGAGTPASIFALLLLGWWVSGRLMPSSGLASGLQPVRIGAWIFGTSVLTSFAAAASRPLSAIEVNGSDRAVLYFVGLIGLLVLTADGIRSRERFDVLVRRIALGGTIIAIVGMLQFFFALDLSQVLRPPGLTQNSVLTGFFDGRIRRVAGTAGHPIEFGVVLSMILLVAVHGAAFAPPERRRWRWIQVMIIGTTLPMSLSRSAVVGLVFGGAFLLSGWPWRRIRQALVVVPIFLVGVRLAVPGVLGTIKSAFVNAGNDPSIQGRTEDYQFIGDFIAQRPFFGRGLGTFNPSEYRLLDNQYLGTILEFGYVGLTCLVLLLLTGVFAGRGARRSSVDERTRDLGQTLGASVVVASAGFFTFDAFSFPMFTGLLFLLLGCCGALWRLQRERVGLAPPPPMPREPARAFA